MMNTPISMALGHPVNDLSHEKICIWLKRALQGEEPLPQLTADEHPHLGILRLEKTLWPTTRRSISDGCLELIRQFSADGLGDDGLRPPRAYLQELLFLTAGFKNPEAVRMLAQLARRFPQMSEISVEIRIAVLAALVDTPPPQPAEFWDDILKQDSEKYAGMALSGMLAINLAQAIKMLPAIALDHPVPDAERAGQAAALKLDLTWDYLPPEERFQLVQDVEAILPHCGSHFASPVAAWTASKRTAFTEISYPGLRAGLVRELGAESAPRYLKPRLGLDSRDDAVGEFYNLPQKPAHQSSASA